MVQQVLMILEAAGNSPQVLGFCAGVLLALAGVCLVMWNKTRRL